MKGPLEGAARRPVAVLMIVTAVVVFGAVSYSRLDLALLPNLNYPTLTVRTEFVGAGPRDVDKRITEVLEKRVATTSGLVSMSSVSRSNFSDITLEFGWDSNMTEVRSDLDAKISAATLPDDAQRPLLLPYDPNLDPILRIAVSSRGNAESDLALARRLAEEEVEKELKKLPGVAAAKIRGGREREIAVHLNEADLRRSGIRLQEVANALRGANRNEAAGLINEGPIEYVVRSVNELRTVEEIEDLVVRRVDEVPVRIGEIGQVRETYKERELAAFLDGREAVLVEVYKKADANLVAVARAVEDRLFGAVPEAAAPDSRRGGGGRHRRGGGGGIAVTKNLSDSLEEWVDLQILTDQSRFIEGAINEVRDTAVLGGILAVLVLYLFLRSALSTFIAGGVIGVCVTATFAPMFLAGVSLNIMSLGGLALGVGMLVDNAIVVLESSARKRAAGLAPVPAAVQGVSEVAGAITASTLTSICVFFPIVFVEEAGVAGQIFRDLALTVVFSILVSLLFALFVIPTCLANIPQMGSLARRTRPPTRFGLSGRLLGDRYVLRWSKLRRRSIVGRLWFGLWLLIQLPLLTVGRVLLLLLRVALDVLAGALFVLARAAGLVLGPLARLFQKAYSGLESAYVPFLRACLSQRFLVIALALGALVYAGWRASLLSPDLIPESQTGEFDVKVSFAPGTPLEQTATRLKRVEAGVRRLPEVEWVATTVGVEADADRAADEGEHTARFTIHLKEETSEDPLAEPRVRDAVDELVRSVPDALPPEFLPSTLFRFAIPLRLVFFGGGERDLGRISLAAEETGREIRGLPGIESVQVGHGRGAREVRLVFDRDQLFRFGLTAEEVAARVRAKVQGDVPTALVEGSARTDIRVRVSEQDRGSLRDLVELDIAPQGRDAIPLRMVLSGAPHVAEGPGEIRRVGGRHAAVVTAAYEGLNLRGISDQAAAIAAPIARNYGVEVDVSGRSREAGQAARAMTFALLLAVFLVYAVMAAQFESLLQPVLIMVSLPLAGVGAIIALDLLDLPLSVVVFLGTILLTGIAVNNAIVLVDCINKRRTEHPTIREAIVAASRERLRPILMTTATTILGLIPLTGLLAGLPGADAIPLGLGGGEAAELRAPMAITVIGGLLTSTLLTLVVVPVLYSLGANRRGTTAA